MSDTGKPLGPGSRIIRERAMAVLRDTRAKIDPRLLAAMKERLSSMMPPQQGAEPVKNDVFGELKNATPKAEAAPISEKIVYPSKRLPEESTSEPVDRQKISQIVLQYMKNREEKQKH